MNCKKEMRTTGSSKAGPRVAGFIGKKKHGNLGLN